jgi:hypothetical protein
MPTRVYISSVISGFLLALVLQPLVTAERISQTDFKALVSANAVAIAETRSDAELARGQLPRAGSLTEADLAAKTPRTEKALAARPAKVPVGCVDWFNAGNPAETAK